MTSVDRFFYAEWSMDPNLDVGDPGGLAAANPALGRRITAEFLAEEAEALDEDELARERYGLWPTPGSEVSAIDRDEWSALADRQPMPDGPVMGLHVSQFHDYATIVAAGARPDGRTQIEVVASRPRSTWVADEAVRLFAAHGFTTVALDGSSSANIVVPELTRAGVRMDVLGFADVVQACGAFVAAAECGSLAHADQPELNLATAAGRQRSYGKSWIWDQRVATNTTPLIAATLAMWTLTQSVSRDILGAVW